MPGIVGLGKAVEIAMATMDERIKKESELRDYLIARIEDEIPFAKLNGHRVKDCQTTLISASVLLRASQC